MKQHSLAPVMALLIAFFMIGCSNPADDVTEANVSNANQTDDTVMASGDQYVIADTSTIEFVGSKVTGSHTGGFKQFTGEFFMEGDSFESAKGKVVIDMNTIFSDSDRLTGHLKSNDFFGVETYPTSTFTCSSVKKQGKDYLINGSLNMHGVTKGIEFPAKITKSGNQITLNAEFFIKRFDWEIVYPGRADDLIRDEVVIKLNLIANKA